MGYVPSRPPPSRHFGLIAGALFVVILAVIATICFAVGFPFTLTVSSGGGILHPVDRGFTTGGTVRFTWSVQGSGPVNFSVVNGLDDIVYESIGTSGSSSFVADGASYQFQSLSTADENVTVQGSATW
jgi:hypothetical protein